MNLANRLTLFRIILIPLFIICFYLPVSFNLLLAGIIFIIAYITDIFDGIYARKHNLVTNFGKLMDPIADKMLTSAALVMMSAFGLITPIISIIIISRELFISGLRMLAVDNGIVLAADKLGKLKTVIQCVGISLVLFSNPFFGPDGFPLDQIVMWIATALTLLSGLNYCYKNRKLFIK